MRIKDCVIEAIKAHGSQTPIGVADLKELIGRSTHGIKNAVHRMVDEGVICCVVVERWCNRKGYCLPDHPMAQGATGRERRKSPVPLSDRITASAMKKRTPLEQVWG